MLEWLVSLPAFIKITATFFGILIVHKCKVPLGVSIILHTLCLTIITGSGFLGIKTLFISLASPEYWLLIMVIVLILFFTQSLKTTGRMDATLEGLKKKFGNSNVLLGGLPAIIGLLPMPGGAIFSAPFINSLDHTGKINEAHKTAINFWFRHIWECWWPLYPGVIFAIHYSQLSSQMFFLLMWPFTIIAVAGGYFFILKTVPISIVHKTKHPLDRTAIGKTFLPILYLIVIAIGGSIILQQFHIERIYANLLSMLAGLCVSIIIVSVEEPKKALLSSSILFTKKTFFLVMVILGVQMFATTLSMSLNSDGASLVSLMRDEMITFGIPIVPVIILIPLISGFVTGVAFAFVGASFPLIFALLGANPEIHVLASTTVLAYVSGYTGMMLSPMHICLVITAQYFKTNLFRVYRYLMAPAAIVFICGIVLSGFYYIILK